MMEPPAVSQILEQFTRVVTMVALAYILLPYGLEYAAAGAAFGAVPGAVTGLIVLSFFTAVCAEDLKQKRSWYSRKLTLSALSPKGWRCWLCRYRAPTLWCR